MEISMKDLAEKLDRLRADLAATNLALAATTTVLTQAQRQDVLQALARASAKKQAFVDQLPISEEAARSAIQLFQEAEGRVHQLLQGAPEQFGKG
jgi:NADP-dependent 3-hydroxy acid dehydrogenase YdfG